MSKFLELFSKNMRSIIGLFIVIGSFGFLFILCFHKVPVENTTIINVATGLVLAALGAVCGYYFGSSKDSSDKNKAEIAQASAAEITTTKNAGEPDPEKQ